MNIYILNCNNTFNYGSMMMGENFISYFNKTSGVQNEYYVETDDDKSITRLKEATNINEIYPVPTNSLFKKNVNKYDTVFSYLKLKNIVSEFALEMDLVVVLGGDDFTEDYGWKPPVLNIMQFISLIKADISVIMLGQTMGPYYSFRKPIMKKMLGEIHKIYPRDPLTYNYLKDLGLKNISITDDLALLALSKQETKERTKEYITYCPSELIYRYSKEGKREDWIKFNLFMIDILMNKYPNKKLVLLAHVLSPEQADDRIIVDELYNLANDKYENRIIIENQEMLPYQVRNYIQQSFFTISSRMHPVVSSIQLEIPAIALSYSSKYWGIIGERYGLGEYILDVRYLDYDELRRKFIKTIDKIELEYEQIQNTMKKNNELASESILNTLKEISEFKK